MFTRSTARVAALACVGALALGACGSGDKQSADSTSATTVQTGDAASATNTTMKATDASSKSATLPCDFITKEQATKLFGHPAEKQDQQNQDQQSQDQQQQNQNQNDQQQNQYTAATGEKACFWESRPEPGTSYLLQIRMADKPYYFTGDLGGYTKLDGLGDKAAVRVSPTGTEVFITWVDGSHSNNVTYSVHKIGAKGLAEKQKDELIALVKKAANG